jgi:hypothetical protein
VVAEGRQAEDRQSRFAQPVVIQIDWKCHDQNLTPAGQLNRRATSVLDDTVPSPHWRGNLVVTPVPFQQLWSETNH